MTTTNIKIGNGTIESYNTESSVPTVFITGLDQSDSEIAVQEWIDGLEEGDYFYGLQAGNSSEFENGYVVEIQ